MGRILIVSNRLPIQITKNHSGFEVQPSTGGLATGVNSIHKKGNSAWIGWPGIYVRQSQAEERKRVEDVLGQEKYIPVFLTPYDVTQYYEGFSNNTIWPLFHYFNLCAVYEPKSWEVYRRVNQKFCDEVVKSYEPGDAVWVHDYQLMLLPQLLRERLPDAKIGYFHHVPFPSQEIFRLLPWREEVLQGLLGANLIGFHTYDYVFHFLSSVRRILGYDNYLGEIQVGARLTKVDVFPMGIDYQRFADAAASPVVEKEIARTMRKIGKRKVILSFDRLDYTKGIPLRLEAFDALLDRKPEYRGKVSFILVAVPSRINVSQYQALKKQIDELVGRINGKYCTTDWAPVSYFSRFLPFETLVALYRMADVGLVTPLRDGMNLMAKEFIATKVNGSGTLVLSEMAGAAQELGEAIIVNPNDREDIVEALEKALVMPVEEQVRHNRVMQKRLSRYDIRRWAEDFLSRLEDAYVKQRESYQQVMSLDDRAELAEACGKSRSRLILLDYDGTLVPLVDRPLKAAPPEGLIKMLRKLCRLPSNEVVLISGRDRGTFDEWFKTLRVGLVAERGGWIKEHGGDWKALEQPSDVWKKQVLPVLETYADRTPGSFVEEKDFSLGWHYRATQPALGSLRAKELKDNLLSSISNLNLEVIEENKVVEIKGSTANKGTAAQNWLAKKPYDFILAIGDDKTDEELFAALPKEAYTIKVGVTPSKARWSISSQKEVLPLLLECVEKEKTRR
jgi:trehalose 6-phosphate synthase/phosphatase